MNELGKYYTFLPLSSIKNKLHKKPSKLLQFKKVIFFKSCEAKMTFDHIKNIFFFSILFD